MFVLRELHLIMKDYHRREVVLNALDGFERWLSSTLRYIKGDFTE